jgi:hypothetical protein
MAFCSLRSSRWIGASLLFLAACAEGQDLSTPPGSAGTDMVGSGGGSSSGSGGSASGSGGSTDSGGTTGVGGTSGSGGTGGTSTTGSGGRGGSSGTGGSSSTGSGGSSAVGTGGTSVTGSGGAAGSEGGSCTAPPFDGGAPGTVLLSDDFEDGNANGWQSTQTNPGGTPMWQVINSDAGSKTYAETGGFSGGSAIYVSVNGVVNWTDVSIEARVRITSWAGTSTSNFVGVCARVTNGVNNFYCAALRSDGRLAIRANINNTKTTLGSAAPVTPPITTGVWYTLKFVVKGPLLNVYLNGSVVPNDTVSDCTITSGGIALAVANGTAEFDDVKVTVP